jgi:hypothetical protein
MKEERVMDQHIEYVTFPAVTIGGGTGNYEIACDVSNGQWAEYAVITVTNGVVSGQASALVNGNSRASIPSALNYVAGAGTSLNKDNSVKGTNYVVNNTLQCLTPPLRWERITNSERRVFVRIDAQASCSAYVSLMFRIAVLKIVPSMPVTVHPSEMDRLNDARAAASRARLQVEQEMVAGGSDVEPAQSAITAEKRHMRYGMENYLKGQE